MSVPQRASAAASRVMVVPDWMDTNLSRWQFRIQTVSFDVTRTYASEEDARWAAFYITGVGDFLAGVTWVEGTNLWSVLD